MLHKLQWRYATKKFDTSKIVEEEQVTELLKSMNLTASSYGLQPYEFVVVKSQKVKQRLLPASYNQEQITEASHVIVLCAKTSINSEYIDQYIQHISELRKVDVAGLKEFGDMMKNTIGSRSAEEQLIWSQKQCYIVLGTLLLAAADLKIDACPMEGFDPIEYNKILGLDEHGLHATVVIPIGHRSVEDKTQHYPKVRRILGDMVKLKYDK